MVKIFHNKILIICAPILLLGGLCLLAFLDIALATGIALLVFCVDLTFFVLLKLGLKEKKLYVLFSIAIFIYLAATLFFHYANFQPFGGSPDSIYYDLEGQRLALRFHIGDFSINGQGLSNWYPVIVGFVYFFTLPKIIILELLNVWLAGLSCILVYLIVREIGKSEKWGFAVGFISAVYPSHIFFASILLKDTLIIPLALALLLLTIKFIKNFSWRKFLTFYFILLFLVNIRFYIGYALILVFILSYIFLIKLNFKKKIAYGVVIVFLLGFIPQISSNEGYYGTNFLNFFLNKKMITYYREIVYLPSPPPSYLDQNSCQVQQLAQQPQAQQPQAQQPAQQPAQQLPTQPSLCLAPDKPIPLSLLHSKEELPSGGSTNIVGTGFDSPLNFVKNNLKALASVLLGPFPWQIKYKRQLLALFETIPWYFLMFFVVKGVINAIKGRQKIILPLILFSLIVFGVLAFYVASNFGIYMRLRVPAFLSLFCLIPLAFDGEPMAKFFRFLK